MNANVWIEHEDDNGVALTPRGYAVQLEYERIIEPDYGADADGHQGMRVVEYDITWVDPDPSIPSWAREEAVRRFEDAPQRYA